LGRVEADPEIAGVGREQQPHFSLGKRFELVDEADPRVELGIAGEALLQARHTHQDQPEAVAIEAQAAVIRITRGNFRLMERLFAQMRRIMTLNRVEEVTADIVQAARDCLVIGPGN